MALPGTLKQILCYFVSVVRIRVPFCLSFSADCHDGLCLVDLSVSAKLPVGVEVPYVIGSTALITLLVTVTNTKIGQYLPHPARDVKLNLPIEDSNNLVPAWYPDDCAIYKVPIFSI